MLFNESMISFSYINHGVIKIWVPIYNTCLFGVVVLSPLCILLTQKDYQYGTGIFPCVSEPSSAVNQTAFEFSKYLRKFCRPY